MATTADAWSAAGNSYLGVTCHWIDEESLARKSCVLACTLMTEAHTGDYIARMLDDIHRRFNIEDTVVRTTTDNGSNFCSAFRKFGKPSARIEAIAIDDECQESDMDTMSRQFAPRVSLFKVTVEDAITEGDGTEFIPLFDTLDQEQVMKNGLYNLPAHARCAAHTLSLIGADDVNKNKHKFDSVHVSALEKATAIWTYHSQSDKFKMTVKKVSKFLLLNLKFLIYKKLQTFTFSV